MENEWLNGRDRLNTIPSRCEAVNQVASRLSISLSIMARRGQAPDVASETLELQTALVLCQS